MVKVTTLTQILLGPWTVRSVSQKDQIMEFEQHTVVSCFCMFVVVLIVGGGNLSIKPRFSEFGDTVKTLTLRLPPEN